MDNMKLEEIEPSSNNVEDSCAEQQTCLLEEDDTQCGHVFYNETTRLLKFFCTYCRETYDNIEYFCQHLSEHINDTYGQDEHETYIEDEEQMYKLEVDEEETKKEIFELNDSEQKEEKDGKIRMRKESSDLEFQNQSDEDTRDAFEYEVSTSAYDNLAVNDFEDTEMIVEEIDDADEIRAEVEQEMCRSLEEGNCLLLNDNSCSSDLMGYDEDTSRSKDLANSNIVKTGNGFEDCFIKETNIDKIRSEGVCVIKEKKPNRRGAMQKRRTNFQDLLRLKRRRKKVTTVKVIAVKNRIAELYERIQNEKEKSQQIFSHNMLQNSGEQQHEESLSIQQQEQETQDAIESLMTEGNEEDNSKHELKSNNTSLNEELTPTKEVTRKIIGNTLITLIPEGAKIPNKFPAPVRESMYQIGNTADKKILPSSYSHYKENSSNSHDKRAVCPACGKTFRSHFSLTIHKRIHYLESDSTVKLAHKCSDCDQLFNKLSQLKHHVETIHYPEGFICKICNRKLSSISLLERHMVKVHLDRPFNCKQCNKNFSDPITFEEHLVSHTSGAVFKCLTCGRKYSTEFFLMEHMRNHKEQVPQTCVVCGKVTLRITQHMKIHTPRPKRLLSCSVCGKVFNFSSGLSHHFKIMHKLPRPPPKPKKEPNPNAVKRKRRNRTSEKPLNKKKLDLNSSSDNSFIINQDKFTDQIIEEQIEIPHENYDNTPQSTMINLETSNNVTPTTNRFTQHNELHHTNNHLIQHHDSHHHPHQGPHAVIEEEDVNHKEEEAKRVIVELIQNSTYTSFFPDNLSSVLEVTPPIAREETISAVNSIVHDC